MSFFAGLAGLGSQLIQGATTVAPAFLSFQQSQNQIELAAQRDIALGRAQIEASARTTRTIAYVALGGAALFFAVRKFG